MGNQSNTEYPQEEEYFIQDFIEKRKKDFNFLWQYRLRIIIACVIGAVFGIIITWLSPVSYTSRLTFVVEESKSGGGSLSALAGQLGFDIGGLSSNSSVLAGDNVQALLKSRNLIKRTLLSPYPDSDYSLADRYAESTKLKEKWAKYVKEGEEIRFPTNHTNYTRLQDSLMHDIIERIVAKHLGISKPDKKLSFFEVNTTMPDEKLSQLFCIRLLDTATNFYIQTRTKKLRTNVNSLQRRADSITRALNAKTYRASAATQVSLDVNPAYPTASVGAEVQQRDKVVLQTIYSEVTKQLESSKMMLIQETPTFQVVDEPELPLKKNRLRYLQTTFICVVIACMLYAFYLLTFRKK